MVKQFWAYNKSLMLNPRDSDVKYNLSIAEARVIDHIEIPKDVALIRLYSGLKCTLQQASGFFVLIIDFIYLLYSFDH